MREVGGRAGSKRIGNGSLLRYSLRFIQGARKPWVGLSVWKEFVYPRPFPWYNSPAPGEVPEWTIGAVSKTAVAARLPRVRIPPSPPEAAHYEGRLRNGTPKSARLRSFSLGEAVYLLLCYNFPAMNALILVNGKLFFGRVEEQKRCRAALPCAGAATLAKILCLGHRRERGKTEQTPAGLLENKAIALLCLGRKRRSLADAVTGHRADAAGGYD